MESKFADVAALLTLEECECLVREKLLPDQPPSVVSSIIRDHGVDAIHANIAMLMKWRHMKPLQANIDTLYTSLAELSGEGRNVKEAMLCLKSSTELFEEIQKEIKTIYARDFGEININPNDSAQRIPVDDLHAEIDLQIVDDVGYKKHLLPSYKEAFSEAGCIDRLVLFGAPGAGKSVQQQIIAFRWVKDGTLGDKYKLVIFLRLSGVNKFKSVSELIVEQLLPHRRGQEASINRMLQEHKGNILFLSDGFDEMSCSDSKTIPSSGKTTAAGQYTLDDLFVDRTAHLLISTRPTRLSNLKQDVFITKKMSIRGLSEVNAKKLAKVYCKHRNIEQKTSEQPIEDYIMAELKKKKLTGLSKNPSLLQILCDWMRENDEISHSITALYECFFEDMNTTFLKGNFDGDPEREEVRRILLSDDADNLMKDLEYFAYDGVMKGYVVSGETDYLRLLKEPYIKVYLKLGMIYFEEKLGSKTRLIGFRHKSK